MPNATCCVHDAASVEQCCCAVVEALILCCSYYCRIVLHHRSSCLSVPVVTDVIEAYFAAAGKWIVIAYVERNNHVELRELN